jgi:hypothetical protein
MNWKEGAMLLCSAKADTESKLAMVFLPKSSWLSRFLSVRPYFFLLFCFQHDKTALMIAVEKDALSVVEVLVAHGANLAAVDRFVRTRFCCLGSALIITDHMSVAS